MCGVFGIHANDRDVARLAYFGLFALQHRGQESAGIAVSDQRPAHRRCATSASSPRSSTSRSCAACAARPRSATRATRPPARRTGRTRSRSSTTAGRGRSRSATTATSRTPTKLREELAERGVKLGSTSDTEVIAALISSDEAPLEEAVANTMRQARGRLLGRRALGGDAARLPRPVRLPPALPRPDPRGLGGRLRDVRARPRRRRVRARGRARRARRDRRRRLPRDAGDADRGRAARSASSSSSTSRGPTRSSTASRCTARACAWASGSRGRRRWRPTSCCRSPTRARPPRSASRARPGSRSARG